LAGAVAGFPLFLSAPWARKVVSVISGLILIATITQVIAFRLPAVCGIVGVFAMVSVALLLLPRYESVA
jgi:hypothetical protein